MHRAARFALVIILGLPLSVSAGEKPIRSFGPKTTASHYAVSADGRRVAWVSDGSGNGSISIWDTDAGTQIHTLAAPFNLTPSAMSLSPDGGRLAAAYGSDSIRIWDTTTGKERPPLKPAAGDLHPQVTALHFGPGGKTLAAYGTDNGFDATALWNVETRSLFWCHTLRGHPAVSPNGATVATLTDCRWVVLVDAATGKEAKRFPIPGTRAGDWVQVTATTISADGRQLAVGFGNGTVVVFNLADQSVAIAFQVNDTANTEHQRGNGIQQSTVHMAFSPDGYYLAGAVMGQRQNAAEVYELATGKKVATFITEVTNVAFTADGRTLIVGSGKSVTVWPFLMPHRDWSVANSGELWTLLGSSDPALARPAMRQILSDPVAGVQLLREKIPAVAAVDAETIAALVAALDAPAFAVREKATRQFATYGDAASTPLRKVEIETTSAEVRTRIERLLADEASLTSNDIRVRRAVTTLATAATPEATALLRDWAAGAPGAKLTVAAAAATKRLR